MKGIIKSSKSFRYYTHGDLKKATHLIFVLHGYGQLAEYFIRKFSCLPEKYFVIAPEGMHRFYLNGSSGRVGASWMTKEDRENDILDNLDWLDKLNLEFNRKKQFSEKTILGFSQGGATAARWYYKDVSKFNRLFIWSSVFPPDLKIEDNIPMDNKASNFFIIGNKDEFFSKEQIQDLSKLYTSKGYKSIIYEGNHDIDKETLVKLFLKLKD